ncbi:protein artichoke [Phymastichus coffea]|uniref:protein artichoke n=1 Tax=Phymastichus coffea TaxID=108790 RepID=UPI00273C8F86|nr:protein artichoke [Phymastichus coffea]
MGKPPEAVSLPTIALLLLACGVQAQEYGCPPQEKILPCRCSTRDMEFQIWCSHSELPRVLEGLKSVSRYVTHPVDELILENNNLLSLPGHVFASLRVLRLMLRNNRLEFVSSGWLEGLHDSLLELFLVEPDLRFLPIDSLQNLQGLEAVTVQSKLMKRLPSFAGLSKLRYLQINSPDLMELSPHIFRDLPSLEQLHIFGSPNLTRLEGGLLRNLPRLQLLNISDCGLQRIHSLTLINLPELKEIAFSGNEIQDARMVGSSLMDLPGVSVLQLDRNKIARLDGGSFRDMPSLSRLSMSYNRITEISRDAIRGVPLLRTLNLNHNRIHRIHPEFVSRAALEGIGVEEVWLMDNDIAHISEIRAILDALPRLKFLEASYNQIQEIQYGALRGHPSLERLHLDYNRLSYLHREVFTAMPALRELRLRNNSLTNSQDSPFWDLPALKGLDLSGNFFRHIEPRLLANLPSLRRLDMSENTIALVDPDAFLNSPALEHVNMSGNALSVLHPMTFRHLNNLYELDIGWNRLLEIIPGLPRNLEHLHLPMNRIVALPLTVTSDSLALPLLRSLDLSANGIEHIPPAALSGLPSLRKLNLGFNALTVVEDGCFEGLGRLEQLDLKYNRIGLLHGRCFMSLANLLDLSLRGNKLEMIRPDAFQSNERLQRLDVSRNNLSQLPHSIFTFTRDLGELHASHNSLPELPSSLHGLENLQILDLSYNKLTALAPETLSSLTNLLELRLARNRVRELREGAFDRLPRLALIDLEDNDLNRIERNAVRALPELQALRLAKNRITMIPTIAFSDLPMLQSVELQENRIQTIARNAFANVPHLLFLNVSHNLLSNLADMRLDSLRSLEVLDLSDNRIHRITKYDLANMEWLVELNLDNNRICMIQGEPFDEMPRLRVLSLRENRMTSVAERAFKRLRSNIAVLDIDGNPLSCSCGMLWLRGWLQQASAEGPRCADGSLFREIRLSKQECERERRLEPPYPECEPKSMGMTASSTSPYQPLSANGNQKSSPRPSAVNQDADYVYDDYDDYPHDHANSTGDFASNSVSGDSSSLIVTPQAIGQNVESPSRSQHGKNTTANKHHGNHGIPPSPSSSGFTFFGVPLPSLSFSLWGNTAKKADRKDDGTGSPTSISTNLDKVPPLTAGVRPARGRYRNFPPTEPEIHRGGFVPLPRAQGGFVPIVDPRLEEKINNISGNGTRFTGKQNESHFVHEKKTLKSSNYTVAKVERISAPFNHTAAPKNTRQRQQGLATSGSIKRPSAFVHKRFKDTISTSTTANSAPTEPERVIITTEVQESQNSEIASKITTTTTTTKKSSTTTKKSVIDEVEAVTSKRTTNNVLKEMPIRTTEFAPLEIITTENSADFLQEMPIDQKQMQPMLPTPTPIATSSTATRNMEASALSALLVPGGQVPQIPVSSSNTRPLGRPTIMKVPSPYIDPTDDKQIKDSHHSGSNVDEAVKLINDGDFNWYFQHYNDSILEPYVGVVYGGSLTSSASFVVCRVPIVLMIISISFWCSP